MPPPSIEPPAREADMAKAKVSETYSIEPDHQAWLETMAESHGLPDASKALRVVLDYAMQDGDEDALFNTIRCRHCG
jgi:hypothetical protein